MISLIERSYFDDLFNRGGYVLDFSTYAFDEFTYESIEIRLCETYNLSKGKSLNKFMTEGDAVKVIKLLDDLLDYYEVRFSEEIISGKKSYSGATYESLYKKCREIINREKEKNQLFRNVSIELKEKFSSDYMNQQIDLMVDMCNENPTEAIGKAKELIESCCKSILESENLSIESKLKMPQLVKMTMQTINVPNESIKMDTREEKIVKQILGNLNGLSSGILELRNHYGSGHGRVKSFQSLSTRHAELAVGSSITLVKYLWDTYLDSKHA